MNTNFKEKITSFYQTFKATYNREKSSNVADIIQRETQKKILEKVAALNHVKSKQEAEKIVTQKLPSISNAIENNKKRKEKRIKAWSDRGYRTIGPAVGGIIGTAIGTIVPGIGNIIGGITGVALGSLVGGRVIQIIAVNYGIPAHKAFKEAKKVFNTIKQETAHRNAMEKMRQTGIMENKFTGKKEFVNQDMALRDIKDNPLHKKTTAPKTPLRTIRP